MTAPFGYLVMDHLAICYLEDGHRHQSHDQLDGFPTHAHTPDLRPTL